MIDAKSLLSDLIRQLSMLESDLRVRIKEVPELHAALQAEWQSARDANRCAETLESWSEQLITQAGVHWLLSCVFLRFIEDNALVERPWLSGPQNAGRLALARDRAEAWFRARPLDTDREYLLAAFSEAATLPGLKTFFDAAHNPVFRIPISADAAMALRAFWQQVNPDTGALKHDFTDAMWNTRFLGDLYQDLSEATRKRYALLQTPEFVEEFILDRTLTPAIQQFGLGEVRLIDPTCGSGHFLLGAYARLVALWFKREPGRNPVDIAQKALDAVAGVDLNPFAVAIARFRLWIAALRTAGVQRLAHAPNFKLNVAIGDSLLHGSRFALTVSDGWFANRDSFAGTGLTHAYASEDLDEVRRILGQQYHAVVGNPPYIVVKDAALNKAYRVRYDSCHMKYSLGAPFTERFFELATGGRSAAPDQAGFVGLITANSFMKREFGSKLIEKVLPQLDLSHVIDTSGAYIPGHGTPTVILFGRHRWPVDTQVRTVMGIKGEPSTPNDPAQGLVWSAIVAQIDQAGSESAFLSVAEVPRAQLGKHPWSIGGGGAADLKELIEEASSERLGLLTVAMGFFGISAADDIMHADAASLDRQRVESTYVRPVISGDEVRDWRSTPSASTLFPYGEDSLIQLDALPGMAQWLWSFRTLLGERTTFSKKSYFEEGRPWWEWHQISLERVRTPLTITFAEVATHNHFVLDRGGKVFKQTAPVIKLPAGSSEDEHLGLLGLLNSSVACFWMKQVAHQKQMMGGDGIRISEKSKVPYQFASTQLKELPLPERWADHPLRPRLLELSREADALGGVLVSPSVASVIAESITGADGVSVSQLWERVENDRSRARSQLILLQEEIDFLCYEMYGLSRGLLLRAPNLDFETRLTAGDRPFCIVAQKNVERFPVPTAIPDGWPSALRDLWRRRIEAITHNPDLRIIEDSHYKRRWIGRQGLFNHGAKSNEFTTGLRDWLLDRLEGPHYWSRNATSPQITTVWRLAEAARTDSDFLRIATAYSGREDVDLTSLIAELVAAEAVPFLPVQRYSESGLRKRAQWEATWALQRREDAGDEVGKIPVPPKYQSKDFSKPGYWKLRGALDVPKERWISYPACERGSDSSLAIVWAGWNHLQQAQALAAYSMEMKDIEGWPAARLQPLLAGLQQLIPWLKQWHNAVDPNFGERMGDYYAGFLADEARAHGYTLADLSTWQPPATTRGRKAKT